MKTVIFIFTIFISAIFAVAEDKANPSQPMSIESPQAPTAPTVPTAPVSANPNAAPTQAVVDDTFKANVGEAKKKLKDLNVNLKGTTKNEITDYRKKVKRLMAEKRTLYKELSPEAKDFMKQEYQIMSDLANKEKKSFKEVKKALEVQEVETTNE